MKSRAEQDQDLVAADKQGHPAQVPAITCPEWYRPGSAGIHG